MEQSTQTNLCQGIRACGLPKAVSREILNTVILWERNNGEEWTVERLKALKQWYETCLAGQPEPPPYFRKTSRGYPTGVWGALFKVRNPAKVLAVLSAGTVFVEKEIISPKQKDKFLSALKGDSTQRRVSERDVETLQAYSFRSHRNNEGSHPIHFPDVNMVTPEDMTGQSIPISNGKTLHLTDSNRRRLSGVALIESWRSIPQACLDYLDDLDHLDWVPENLSDIPYTPRKRVKGNPVGRIGIIQEPALKARTVANPNRVAQALSYPLAYFWERNMMRFPSDCTFDQEKGIRWVQTKLSAGICLSGSDLSSATDLLDLDCCLQLARAWCLPTLENRDIEQVHRHECAIRYFRNLSRGTWDTPDRSGLGRVRWEQGQPLGLYPSFRLLAITNNGIGCVAAINSGLDPTDSFRVIGDDIIMDSRMEPEYTRLIESLGGIVNHSKTITSSKVAEFAGRVILPNRVMMKTYKFKLPSDDSFMQIVSDLGPQAKGLLANRQRKAWEDFKFVPGIAYDGPWSKDSFGIPLEERVAWTESTHIVDEAPDPDPVTVSLEQELLKSTLYVAGREHTDPQVIEADLPWPVDEDIQSSRISGQPRPSGDPRRKDGKSTLQRLEDIRRSRTFRPFSSARKRLSLQDSGTVAETQQDQAATRVVPKKTLPMSSDVGAGLLDRDKPDEQERSTPVETLEPTKGPEKPRGRSKPPLAAGRPRTVDDLPDIPDPDLEGLEAGKSDNWLLP